MKKMFPVFSRNPPKSIKEDVFKEIDGIPEWMFDRPFTITGDPDLDAEYVKQLAKAFIEHTPGPGITYMTLGPKPKNKKGKS